MASKTKLELVNLLVQDFKETTEDFTVGTVQHLQLMLWGLDLPDLELLYKQVLLTNLTKGNQDVN